MSRRQVVQRPKSVVKELAWGVQLPAQTVLSMALAEVQASEKLVSGLAASASTRLAQ